MQASKLSRCDDDDTLFLDRDLPNNDINDEKSRLRLRFLIIFFKLSPPHKSLPPSHQEALRGAAPNLSVRHSEATRPDQSKDEK
uniref:Uncharacterized protein n=1 Tax=Romanomermis culicivorax TaxID=13658 RepID=A0A915JDI8_ROMCU